MGQLATCTGIDSFIQQLSDPGTVESKGTFTLDPVLAFEKMRDRRTLDVAFPYWKFLQAAVAGRASSVVIKLKKATVTLQAFSEHQFPPLATVCESLPVDDPVLEPLCSAALSLRSEMGAQGAWVVEDIEEGQSEGRLLHQGDYFEVGSAEASALLPRRSKEHNQRFRLFLEHRWGSEGNFFSRLRANMKRRGAVFSALRSRVRFYPLPLDLDGSQGQSSMIDELVTNPRIYSHRITRAAFNNHPAILHYRATDPGNPQRFLSEPLYPWYDVVVEVTGPASHPLPGRDERVTDRRTHVLVLETDQTGEPTEIPRVRRPRALLSFRAESPNPTVRLSRFPKRVSGIYQTSEGGQRVYGHAFLVRSACFIPHRSEDPGKLCIIDRGIALGLIETDLGIPWGIVLKPRGGLRVDLSGGNIVHDETWDEFLRDAREELRQTLRLGGRYIESSMTSHPFISKHLSGL